jgi:phage shock protein PspC (stress-responsive transcriptional regulator)
MDKTININLAGTLFQIDEEAFRILRDWLQAITNRLRNAQGGPETIEDIESRVAEILRSQRGTAGVISKENVESVIAIIGRPEDFESFDDNTETTVYSSPRKRMYRNPDDMILGGVCGGIGAYLNIDPVLFRILFVLFSTFGVGAFIYIILWIALPPANTDTRKREMYGNSYNSAMSYKNRDMQIVPGGSTPYNSGYYNSSRVGNAINELFSAVGRVLFVIMRIFLIFIGIMLVLTGSLAILTVVMVLVFKLPGVFSPDNATVHFLYIRDFLNYVVNPAATPWIIALTLLAVILPMLALIYWGVKMIFWFKARDGIYSLVALVFWVLTITILGMLLFNEGISFAETGRSDSRQQFNMTGDTLFITTGHKSEDLKTSKEFTLPDDEYSVFIDDTRHQLFINTRLNLRVTEGKESVIEIRKRSSGRTRADASIKAESLEYNYTLNNDTLRLDEYFALPSGKRWSGDNVDITLSIPENTILYFDNNSAGLLDRYINVSIASSEDEEESFVDYDTEPWQLKGKFWKITRDGLSEAEPAAGKVK